MGFVKMSLLWFYLRLDPRKYMRWAVFFVMFFNIGLSLASFIGALSGCSPPSLFWTDPTSDGCMEMGPQQRFYEVNGILNIVTDILTYLLPAPMLYTLQLSWRKKGAILGIFGLGILSIAGKSIFNLPVGLLLILLLAACVRYNFVTKLSSAEEEYYLLLADSLNWCTIEAYVGMYSPLTKQNKIPDLTIYLQQSSAAAPPPSPSSSKPTPRRYSALRTVQPRNLPTQAISCNDGRH